MHEGMKKVTEETGEKFAYSYTAPTEKERKEIAAIRRQYQPQTDTESKLKRLRALDKRVKDSATIAALCFGIVGCLIFGGGMALTLEAKNLSFGIPVSIIGMIPMVLAYPMYNKVLCRSKKKYGGEIIKLSDELLSEEN